MDDSKLFSKGIKDFRETIMEISTAVWDKLMIHLDSLCMNEALNYTNTKDIHVEHVIDLNRALRKL